MEWRKSIFFLSVVCLLVHTTEAQKIILTPKWTAQAQFIGYYVAEQMGFYKEEGLDVQVKHPAVSESSFSILQEGRSQVAVMNLSFALTADADLVNVMQTSQENSLMLVSRLPLENINSLQHKKVAIWNHLSDELLDRLKRYYHLDVEWIRFNSGVNLFLSGAVDICLVGSYNEYIQLAECGFQSDSSYIYRFSDYGYNLPEDGLYVTREFYQSHSDTVAKIVRASVRGWKWAGEHPEQALDIIMEVVRRNNIGTNRYHQRKMLEEQLRLQVDESTHTRTYHLSRQGFERAANILLDDKEKSRILYEDFVK